MKMEGSNSELIKISSAKTADTGGLTFGPAWLRQLSSGDSTKMSGLPPSPGLTFQLAKHRYGREEMLAIYETIEKVLFNQSPPNELFTEFEDLLKKDLQRPVLLSQPSQEEQKYLSTCVNSAAALGAYNKLQGGGGGASGGRGGEAGSIRGGAGRGSRGANAGGQSGRGSYGGERGGRGRGRGRGGSDSHAHSGKPPALDEDGNPIPVSSSNRGGGRGGYSRGSYSRTSNWEERESGTKKEYSRAMADDNWRSKASISETDETDEKDLVQEDKETSESENTPLNSNSSTDLKNDGKSKKEWRNSKEWSNYKKSENKNKMYEKIEPHPEWLNDDNDDKDTNSDDMKKRMTFDESGKFVPVKEEPNEQELNEKDREKKSIVEEKSKSGTKCETDELAEKMTQAVIDDESQQKEPNEVKSKKDQANLLSVSNKNVQNKDPKLGPVSMDHPEAERWFYLDPQNQIQGSFSSEQMAGWLTAGYFSMSLMVKRGCDEKFVPLGVLTQNLGRMPFSSSPPKNLVPKSATNSQQLSHDQIQMFQQTQFLPQNYHLLQAYIASQQKAGQNTANLNNVIQQIQQIQLQQKAVVASLGTLGDNGVINNLNELRNKQEALINQCNLNSKSKQGEVFTGLDPAILDAALPNQPVWNEQQHRISPSLNPTPPSSISPINNLIQGATNPMGLLNPLMSQGNMMLGHQMNSNIEPHPIKDKIQALFEITKLEEEKRRKLEKEQQMKLRIEEEERRRHDEAKIKQQQEEAAKRAEEDRIREEMRKEQQKKKLQEIIKLQEEEKRRNEEIKKRREEERKKAEELKKLKEEQKRLEMIQKQQLEEAERKRQIEQQAEMARKQAELERQKQKLQQEQLNKLKLPSHAQWAKQQSSQFPNVDLKSVLEQQALEQKMIEQMKQAEALNQLQNSSSSTWSSLFRGQQQSPPNSGSLPTLSLANIQVEQKNTEKNANVAQKSQTKSSQQSSAKQTWANAANSNSKPQTQTNDNNGGFWTEVGETKPKQQVHVKATSKETETKQNKKTKDNQSAQQKILHNMTISEEFMRWCHEQLKDFQADLHIPTFVNFLREIESCAEIEDYVINYLGESKQAKDFAQQFFINRESQLSQQTNLKQVHDDPSSQFNLREGSFSTKQKQKRRSKGQKLDNQLLGFTVQPDPNLKNRGDIDML